MGGDPVKGRFWGCQHCVNDGRKCQSIKPEHEFHKYFQSRWNMLRKIADLDPKTGLLTNEMKADGQKFYRILNGDISFASLKSEVKPGKLPWEREDLIWTQGVEDRRKTQAELKKKAAMERIRKKKNKQKTGGSGNIAKVLSGASSSSRG